MLFLLAFSLVFFITSSILLTLLVLLQNDQGEGLGGLFSGSSNSPFGAAGVNIIQKITSMLGFLFFVSAITYNFSNRFHYSINKDLREVTKNLKHPLPGKEKQDAPHHDWWKKFEIQSSDLKNIEKITNNK